MVVLNEIIRLFYSYDHWAVVEQHDLELFSFGIYVISSLFTLYDRGFVATTNGSSSLVLNY